MHHHSQNKVRVTAAAAAGKSSCIAATAEYASAVLPPVLNGGSTAVDCVDYVDFVSNVLTVLTMLILLQCVDCCLGGCPWPPACSS